MLFRSPSAAVAALAPPAPVTPPAPVAKPPAAPVVAAITPAPAPAPAAAAAPAAVPSAGGAADKEIEAAVRAWAASWSAKDVSGYLAAYGKDFDTPGKQARKSWEDDRRARIIGKSSITVKLNDVVVSSNGAKATAKFKQTYSADSLNVTSRKTLELVKAGDRWVIVRESTG